MKKLLLLAALFFGTIGAAAEDAATDYISGSLKVASDYSSAAMTVSLTKSVSYVAFQMDITFPESFSNMSDADLTVSSGQDNSTSAFVAAKNWVSTNKLRIVCYNMGNVAFAGKSGDVLFTVTIKGTGATKASDWTAKFSNVLFVTESALEEATLDMKNADGTTITNPGASTLIGEDSYSIYDVNKDGDIDAVDLTAWLYFYNYIYDEEDESTFNANYDINGDGDIDAVDLTAWLYYYNYVYDEEE